MRMNDSAANLEEKITDSQQDMKSCSFADRLNDGIYETNPEGMFVYVNAALVKILGCENPDEIIGRSFMEFIEPSFKEEMLQRYTDFQHSGEPSSLITVMSLRKDGSTALLEIKPGHASTPWVLP